MHHPPDRGRPTGDRTLEQVEAHNRQLAARIEAKRAAEGPEVHRARNEFARVRMTLGARPMAESERHMHRSRFRLRMATRRTVAPRRDAARGRERRPASRSSRSSAASGDSGDSDPEPPGGPAQQALTAVDAAGRLSGIAARLRKNGGLG